MVEDLQQYQCNAQLFRSNDEEQFVLPQQSLLCWSANNVHEVHSEHSAWQRQWVVHGYCYSIEIWWV